MKPKFNVGDEVNFYSNERAGYCDGDIIGIRYKIQYVVKRTDGLTEEVDEGELK